MEDYELDGYASEEEYQKECQIEDIDETIFDIMNTIELELEKIPEDYKDAFLQMIIDKISNELM